MTFLALLLLVILITFFVRERASFGVLSVAMAWAIGVAIVWVKSAVQVNLSLDCRFSRALPLVGTFLVSWGCGPKLAILGVIYVQRYMVLILCFHHICPQLVIFWWPHLRCSCVILD